MKDLTAETVALLAYLEARALSESESCAVMGEAICSLIKSPERSRGFLRILESKLPKAMPAGRWSH